MRKPTSYPAMMFSQAEYAFPYLLHATIPDIFALVTPFHRNNRINENTCHLTSFNLTLPCYILT